MTIADLLSALGRAWPRLLLYPGGLAAFALVWLLIRSVPRRAVVPATLVCPLDPLARTSALAAPWLALALLPLPGAATLPISIDALVTLALLEWPLWLTLSAALRHPDSWQAAARWLAAVLNGYLPLLLGLLLLAEAAGSLDLTRISPPGSSALVWWVATAGMLLALPPLLGLGPFVAPLPADPLLRLSLQLRSLGLGALALLPWFVLLAELPWAWPVPPLLLGLLLLAFDRLAAGAARRWAWLWFAFALTEVLVLAAAAFIGLAQRIA